MLIADSLSDTLMRKKTALIFGGTGMLGHKLIQVLSEDFSVAFTIRSDKNKIENFEFVKDSRIFEKTDVEDIQYIEKILVEVKPDFVINAVGIIKQLPESKNDLITLDINSIFPRRIAGLAEKYGFKLITVSTDCVFSGKKGNYAEDDPADAEDLYGKSKFLGEANEKNCLTIRTSIIGRELFSRHSLLEWFLNNRDETVKGFTNAIFSGFPTLVLAELIKRILLEFSQIEGLYHVSSEPISKYDLLNLIKKEFDLKTEIVPYDDFVIDRSLDSTRFRKLTGFIPESWEKMIKKMADDSTPYDKWRKEIF